MTKFRVIKHQKYYLSFSAIMVILSLIFLFTIKLNLGIDFKGGNLIQLKYPQKVEQVKVNGTLDNLISAIPQLKTKRVQFSETDNSVIIRTSQLTNAQKNEMLTQLEKNTGKYEITKDDTVGAVIGKELTMNAIKALLIGSIFIVIYITVRFELVYAIAGILALLHDVIISFGLIALFRYEIDTPFVAAILTILGYSINDTIVVFDRIRENEKKSKKNRENKPFSEIVETGINQVFARSIYTSLTTLFSVIVLLIFGGDSLKTFSMTLFLGMLFGTYSSIFVASPLVYLMKKLKKNNNNDKKQEKSNRTTKTVNGYDEKDKVLV
ncbi:protein translocase subunit SecF [Leptotrichia sp. oral taxon 218]|jgi:protein-export membrane protein, secD/secF family|uniref:protein translocase subunit SecF n=1 Tax=Leptotrichia sp. oral taxon 218 TaxID=712361 RepID=UPI001B8D0422|nr:protein translocase subunit SecF [Leptotrichia sp. oral taxon 218]QUB95779.1 protein translocase subunit SecF [Leptotrichia sp. oral taxon 218]